MTLTQIQLKQHLSDAENVVVKGATYRHYKSSNMTYILDGLAVDESSEKVVVIYRATYGEKIVFSRPLSSWTERVEGADGKLVSRFERINIQ